MKSSFFFLIYFVFSSFGVQIIPIQSTSGDILEKQPEFYVLEWKEGAILTPQKTDLFIEVDSLGKQRIDVLLDQNNEPVLYVANISTSVCADGECKLMHIKLYWTLLGEYAGFDRYPGMPLTKHDHDEFKIEDYYKLHALLIDDKSILGQRRIDQLVEKPKLREVNGVDAISGATIAEVKESVVSGALYSCYTAWRIVHGEVRQKLKSSTLSVLNENILNQMLYSSNQEYQIFAIGKLDQNQYEEHYERISEIFVEGIPLVRNFIVKSLSDQIWESHRLSQPFWYALPKIDIGSRSLLLGHLQFASPDILEKISEDLDVLTKNQLKIFLESLINLKLSPRLEKNLVTFAETNEVYGYLVKEYLEEY